MEMKQDKEIVEFFNRYAGEMLPEDNGQFMERLRRNIEWLPTPQAMRKMDPELSKAYGEWLLKKMKREYRQSVRDTVISCILTCVTLAVVFLWVFNLGVLDTNPYIIAAVSALIMLLSVGMIYCLAPFRNR